MKIKPHQRDALRNLRERLVYELNMDLITGDVNELTEEDKAQELFGKHLSTVRAIHGLDTALEHTAMDGEYAVLRNCAVGAICRLPDDQVAEALRSEGVLDTANVVGIAMMRPNDPVDSDQE